MSPATVPVSSVKGYRDQCLLEQEARNVAMGRFDRVAWRVVPAQFTLKEHGAEMIRRFVATVESAHKQPGYLAAVLARIPDKECAQAIAADAMLYLLARACEAAPREDIARKLGLRSECTMLLHHPSIRESWHRDAVIKLAASNATIGDLEYRLRTMKILRGHRHLTPKQRAALGLLLIEMLVQTGLIAYQNRRTSNGQGWRTDIEISPSYRDFTENWRKAAMACITARWPMIRPPAPWVTGVDGGYYTQQENLITGGLHVWRKVSARCEEHLLAVVNQLQAQPVRINQTMLDLLRGTWALGQSVGTLPAREERTLPERTFHARYTKAYWRDLIAAVEDRKQRATRTKVARVITLAERLAEEPRLYRPVHYDSRGRIYYRSEFSLQQVDHIRSLIEWPDDQVDDSRITHQNRPWFAWQLMGYIGGQTSLEDADEWIAAMWPDLCERAGQIMADCDVLAARDMKSPWSGAALLAELYRIDEDPGRPVRHMFRLDQTCSGYGHVAALTWDHELARATNLIGTTKGDLYSSIVDRAEERLAAALVEAQDAKARHTLERIKQIGIDRDLIKHTCMPMIYGGVQHTVRQKLKVLYRTALGNVVDDNGVRPGDLATWGSRLIWGAAKDTLPRLLLVGSWIKQVAKLQMEHDMVPHWWTPDGMRVESYRRQHVEDRVLLAVRGAKGYKVKGMNMYLEPEDGGLQIDQRRTLLSVGPDFVHSMDACFLRMVVAGWDGPLETVHDCFATTLGRVEELNLHLRETFARLYSEDVLSTVRAQVLAELPGCEELLPPPPKASEHPIDGIGENLYLFC